MREGISVREDDEPAPAIPGEHATHVAGIIGSHGILSGFAPEAEILCVNALNRDGECDHHQLSEGISLALEAGADVILVSGGFNYLSRELDEGHGGVLENDDYQSLNQSVSTALEFGSVVVAAAGNLHQQATSARARGQEKLAPNELLTPGIIDGVITVGAVDNNVPARRACFSSFDRSSGGLSKPEIMAPGIGIRSTIPVPRTRAGIPRTVPAERCLGQLHGTSQAAPMVAAAVAMLIQKRREEGRPWSPAEIKEELLDHCTAQLQEEGTGRGMLHFPS